MAALEYMVERVKKLEAENERLQVQMKEMESKNDSLQDSVRKSTEQNEMLIKENTSKRLTSLTNASVRLQKEVVEFGKKGVEEFRSYVLERTHDELEIIEHLLLGDIEELRGGIEEREQSHKDEVTQLLNKAGEGVKRAYGSIERETPEEGQPSNLRGWEGTPDEAVSDTTARSKKRKTNI